MLGPRLLHFTCEIVFVACEHGNNRYMSQYGMKTLLELGFADDISESC